MKYNFKWNIWYKELQLSNKERKHTFAHPKKMCHAKAYNIP